jgi:hypothetical protein
VNRGIETSSLREKMLQDAREDRRGWLSSRIQTRRFIVNTRRVFCHRPGEDQRVGMVQIRSIMLMVLFVTPFALPDFHK